ncbi:MAG: phosphatase PAP2 family protein [Desulfonauticus sp.]|nr:phosphatase PAP2 family protein [Desulfonauticus sp.]
MLKSIPSYFKPLDWELHLFWLINHSWKNIFFDYLMPILSSSTFWGIIIACFLLYCLGKKRFYLVIYLILALCWVGINDFTSNIPKKQIGRIRPLNALPGCHFFEDNVWHTRPKNFTPSKPRGTSYPSAHAANSFLLCALLGFKFRRLKKYLWFIPLVIGYSRIYLGKHYPLDILAGYLWGLVFFLLFLACYYWGETKYEQTNWFRRIFKTEEQI